MFFLVVVHVVVGFGFVVVWVVVFELVVHEVVDLGTVVVFIGPVLEEVIKVGKVNTCLVVVDLLELVVQVVEKRSDVFLVPYTTLKLTKSTLVDTF